MATTFRSIWQGAAFRSDLSVNGVGPHASERVTDPEWRRLVNAAVQAVWRLAANARPDFQVSSADFTLVSGASASFAVPSAFFDWVDVVANPDTVQEFSLGPFAWQNRRAPGGWSLDSFGYGAPGATVARLMGDNIYVEPSLRAGGIYRLWYCPKPKQIRADATVTLATTTALPTVTAAGSGVGKTLTEVGNGALTVDGVAAVATNTVLVQNQSTPTDNGFYTVTNAGSAGTPFVLTRTPLLDQASKLPLGFMAYVSAGVTSADLFFELTSTLVTVDVTPMNFTEAFIDPIIEQFAEAIELLTAIPAMQRDDDLDPRPLVQRLYGTDGVSGLIGEMKAYFRQVRMGGTVSKMVDTDHRGPRLPWGF